MTKNYEDCSNHRKCSLTDTSAESLLQINLYFKPAVEWNLKAQSSV